ncbi:MAG TPA: TSUP family transporter [Marinagarivorans sp.]|nr:TSUP family transporter [Marinagarivorans sp.]
MLSIDWLLIYLALGIFVGFMAGLLGIGGGGILVPMLVSIFTYQGFAPEHVVHLALGTALACMIVTASASLRAHALKGTVHWPLAFGLAPGIILGAYLMARSSVTINPRAIALFFAILWP